jgi:Protein of unknown function (DUF3040)
VPLSDEEERVFAQIERQLASQEPSRRSVRPSRPAMARPDRAVLGSCLLALVALAVTVIGVGAHLVIGVVGFVAFFAAMLNVVRALLGPYFTDES